MLKSGPADGAHPEAQSKIAVDQDNFLLLDELLSCMAEASTQHHTPHWFEHGDIGIGLMEMMRMLGSGLGYGEGSVLKPSLHLWDNRSKTCAARRETRARPGRLLETSAKAT